MININNTYFDATVKDILEAIREDTKGEYLKQIKYSSNNIMITCPFHSNHNENHPSCGVVNDENASNYGVFHCFTCGNSGTILDLIAGCFNSDISFAIYWLQTHFNVILVKEEELLPEIELDKKVKTNYLNESILEDYKYIHPYMFERGLTEDIIRKFNIGCTSDGKYITFPCWDEHNNLIGICKRSTQGKEFILPKHMPKCIYLLNYLITNHITTAYVCEGQFDALTLWKYGYPAIALFGAGTSKTQIEILNRSGIRNYILMYDNDAAGRHGAQRFKNLIRKDVFVTDIIMPKGKDCADCTKKEIDDLIKNNS